MGKLMTHIKWHRVYSLKSTSNFFKIFLSAHSDGNFYGSILYYKSIDVGLNTRLDLQMKTIIGTSEENTYADVLQWVNDNLEGNFVIKEEEYHSFESDREM